MKIEKCASFEEKCARIEKERVTRCSYMGIRKLRNVQDLKKNVQELEKMYNKM